MERRQISDYLFDYLVELDALSANVWRLFQALSLIGMLDWGRLRLFHVFVSSVGSNVDGQTTKALNEILESESSV